MKRVNWWRPRCSVNVWGGGGWPTRGALVVQYLGCSRPLGVNCHSCCHAVIQDQYKRTHASAPALSWAWLVFHLSIFKTVQGPLDTTKNTPIINNSNQTALCRYSAHAPRWCSHFSPLVCYYGLIYRPQLGSMLLWVCTDAAPNFVIAPLVVFVSQMWEFAAFLLWIEYTCDSDCWLDKKTSDPEIMWRALKNLFDI